MNLEESYRLVEENLKEVLKITVDNVNWRVSILAVHNFLARFYLFCNDYDKALKYADLALQADARLVNMLYPVGEAFPKKPSKIYMYNSNLMYPICPVEEVNWNAVRESFFLNQLQKDNQVNAGLRGCQFLVNNKYNFKIGENNRTFSQMQMPLLYLNSQYYPYLCQNLYKQVYDTQSKYHRPHL